jgi:hypothetical protein
MSRLDDGGDSCDQTACFRIMPFEKHSVTPTILPDIHGEVFPIPKRQGWCSVDLEAVFRDITTRVKWLEGGHRRPHASIPSKQMFRIRIRSSREQGVRHDDNEDRKPERR